MAVKAPAGLALSAALALAAVVCASVGHRRWSMAARASAGVNAEQKVARSLERLPSSAVLHNVLLGRGDVDHVVLGPVCWAVETKYGRGKVSFTGGRVLVNGRALPRDPIGQARASASLLSSAAGVPALAVLVVSEGQLNPQNVDGVWVCSPGHLGALFSSSHPVLSPARVSSLVSSLSVASAQEV